MIGPSYRSKVIWIGLGLEQSFKLMISIYGENLLMVSAMCQALWKGDLGQFCATS